MGRFICLIARKRRREVTVSLQFTIPKTQNFGTVFLLYVAFWVVSCDATFSKVENNFDTVLFKTKSIVKIGIMNTSKGFFAAVDSSAQKHCCFKTFRDEMRKNLFLFNERRIWEQILFSKNIFWNVELFPVLETGFLRYCKT